MTLAGGSWNLAKAMGAANAHRMLVLVVNAQSEMNVEFQQTEVDLSLGEAITATSSIPLNEYTFDSLSLLRLALDGVAVAKVVEITVGESVDLVSNGSRGGKILRLAAAKGFFKEGTMDKALALALIKKYCPRLLEGVDEEKISDEDAGKLAQKALYSSWVMVGVSGSWSMGPGAANGAII